MESSGTEHVREDAGGAPPPPAREAGDGADAVDASVWGEMDENVLKNQAFPSALSPEEAEKCTGEWTAVAGGRLVAHGKDPEEACKMAHEAGAYEPYIRYIFAKPEEVPWPCVPEQ